MIDKAICERIVMIRKTLGLTQLALSKKLSVNQGNVADIERKTREPSKEMIKELISECGINANWLLTGEGEMFLPGGDNQGKKAGQEEEKMRRKIEELEAQLTRLRKEVAALEEGNDKLEGNYNQLRDKNEELMGEINERLRQIVGLQEKLIPNT